MSSTERAPEPTMEEILASIRRIISDDEANATPQGGSQAQAAAAEETEEGAADIQIIDDIARVLSGANAAAEGGEEEILDLTEPGEVLVETAVEAEFVEELIVSEIVETDLSIEPQPTPDFTQAFPPASQDQDFHPGSQDMVAPRESFMPSFGRAEPSFGQAEPSFGQAEPSFAPASPVGLDAPTSPFGGAPSTSGDPSSALERAIAALKAGDLAAFAREAESRPLRPEPVPVAVEAPPELPPYTPLGAAPEMERLEEELVEEELVIAGELEPAPPLVESSVWPGPEPMPEAPPAPWRDELVTKDFARKTNGGSHETHDFAAPPPKSLEESVKEMLRPMLRQWLDENMQRVLTQALRDELEDSEGRRPGD